MANIINENDSNIPALNTKNICNFVENRVTTDIFTIPLITSEQV